MFCSQCGTDLLDDSQFCRKCGQSLSVAATSGGAAAAVAPARIATPVPTTTNSRTGHTIAMRLIGVLLFLFVVWQVIRINYGSNGANQALAVAVHAPITLKDEVENLPASSWKAVPLSLPYSGSINVSLQVVRGNPVDVFLTGADQLETIKKEEWNNVQVYTDFNALKTTTYRRDEQLGQGGYYLVIRDTSLGILSASASDISMKIQLKP
jgi:hypothetical protein